MTNTCEQFHKILENSKKQSFYNNDGLYLEDIKDRQMTFPQLESVDYSWNKNLPILEELQDASNEFILIEEL